MRLNLRFWVGKHFKTKNFGGKIRVYFSQSLKQNKLEENHFTRNQNKV